MHPPCWYEILTKPQPSTPPLPPAATRTQVLAPLEAAPHRKIHHWRSRRLQSCGSLTRARYCSAWEIWDTGTSNLPSGEPFLNEFKRRLVFDGSLQCDITYWLESWFLDWHLRTSRPLTRYFLQRAGSAGYMVKSTHAISYQTYRICGLIGHMVNFLRTKPWTIYPAWRVVQTKQFYKSTRNNRSWEEVRLRLLDKLIVKWSPILVNTSAQTPSSSLISVARSLNTTVTGNNWRKLKTSKHSSKFIHSPGAVNNSIYNMWYNIANYISKCKGYIRRIISWTFHNFFAHRAMSTTFTEGLSQGLVTVSQITSSIKMIHDHQIRLLPIVRQTAVAAAMTKKRTSAPAVAAEIVSMLAILLQDPLCSPLGMRRKKQNIW